MIRLSYRLTVNRTLLRLKTGGARRSVKTLKSACRTTVKLVNRNAGRVDDREPTSDRRQDLRRNDAS
jgi:hypothetical protein